MKTVNEVDRRKRGRPFTGRPRNVLLASRVPPDLLVALDACAARKGLTRSEAIRRLVEEGLRRTGEA